MAATEMPDRVWSRSAPVVHVVDDDPEIRELLGLMVRSAGLNVRGYDSAEQFVGRFSDSDRSPRCLVLDVRMPGMSGPGLQEKLAADGVGIPVIMISGYATVPMAVEALDRGAVHFLEKPFDRESLLKRIRIALDEDARRRRRRARQAAVDARLKTLSPREREVMDLLVEGKHAKQIAFEFGISEKTVAKHRSRVLDKMEVDGTVQLVRTLIGED